MWLVRYDWMLQEFIKHTKSSFCQSGDITQLFWCWQQYQIQWMPLYEDIRNSIVLEPLTNSALYYYYDLEKECQKDYLNLWDLQRSSNF